MRFRSHIATLLSAAAVGIILAPRAADAELVQLTFSGTYDISHGSVFGESGSAVPFRYELTYDTDLGVTPFFIASGDGHGWRYDWQRTTCTDTTLLKGRA